MMWSGIMEALMKQLHALYDYTSLTYDVKR